MLSVSIKTTNLQMHHAFLYISLPSLHYYDVKLPNFTFCGRSQHKTATLFFISCTLIQPSSIQLGDPRNEPTLDEMNGMG